MKIQKQLLISSKETSLQMITNLNLDSKKKNISRLEIEKIIKRILTQEKSKSPSLNDKEIKQINVEIKSGKITYKINKDKSAINLEESESNLPSDLVIKMMSTAADALPKRFRSPKEIRNNLLENHPVTLPVIRFLWNFITFPLSVLIFSIKPRVYDTTDLKKLGLVNDKESLLTALKWSQKALKLESEDDPYSFLGKEFSINAQFIEAIKLGTKWDKTKDKTKLSNALAKTIIERMKKLDHNNEASNRATNLMMIPSGYWKEDKTFQPVLWSIYRNDKGKLAVSQMSYSQAGENTARDYVWDQEITESDLGKFMDSILALSQKREPALPNPKAVIGKFASEIMINKQNQLKYKFGIPKPTPIEKTNLGQPANLLISINPEEFIQKSLLSSGATIINRDAQRRVSVRENPWKIVHETLRLQFPEAESSDKISFTFSLLNDRLLKIIKALPDMSKTERSQWLAQVTHDKESFERQLKKATTQEDAFALFIEKNGVFTDFSKRIEKLELEIEKLDKASKKTQSNRASGLNIFKKSRYVLRVPMALTTEIHAANKAESKKTKKKIETSHENAITASDRTLLNTIKAGFINPSEIAPEDVLSCLKDLQKRMDKLNEQGQYSASIDIYRGIISHLPTPNCEKIGEKTYWEALIEKANESSKSEIFTETSASLTKLTEYYWEAKLKTHAQLLEADEWVHNLGVEAALNNLLNLRKEWVEGKPMKELTYDDYVIQGLANIVNPDHLGKNITSLLKLYSKLPSANPAIDEKLSLLSLYTKDEIDKKHNKQTADLSRKSEVFDGNLTLKEAEEITKRWSQYYGVTAPNYNLRAVHDFVPKGMFDRNPFLKKGEYQQFKNIFQSFYSADPKATEKTAAIPAQISNLFRYDHLRDYLQNPDRQQGQYSNKILKKIQNDKRLELIPPKSIDYNPYKVNRFPVGNKIADFRDNYTIGVRVGFSFFGPFNFFQNGIFYRASRSSKISNPEMINSIARDNSFSYGSNKNIQSEHGWLQQEMKAPGNPFDNFTSDAEQVIINSSPRIYSDNSNLFTESVYREFGSQGEEVYNPSYSIQIYSSKSIEEAFDLAIQSFDLYDDPKNQLRHYFVCNRSFTAQRLLRENPEYFIRRGQELRLAIDLALKRGQRNRAIFLANLSSGIVKQAEFALNATREPFPDLKVDKELMKQVIEKMPSLTDAGLINEDGSKTSRNLLDLMGTLLHDTKITVHERVDYASNILSFAAKDASALSPEKIKLFKDDPMSIALMLTSLNMLEVGSHISTVQEQSSAAHRFGKENLIPALLDNKMALSHESLGHIFDRWVSLEEGITPPSGTWDIDPANPHLYTKGEITIDLQNHKITRKGVQKKGLIAKLPDQVLKQPHYIAVFQDKNFDATVTIGKKPEELIYSFNDSNGIKTRLSMIKTTGSITIEKLFPAPKGKSKEGEWHRYLVPLTEKEPAKGFIAWIKRMLNLILDKYRNLKGKFKKIKKPIPPKGIETLIVKNGMWVNLKDPSKARAFLETAEGNKNPSSVFLSFNRKNLLVKAVSETGQPVVSEKDDRLAKILNPIGPKHIAFFRSKITGHINEIKLLDQGIAIKRKSLFSPWIVDSKKFKGFEWVLGGGKASAATKLLKPLGVSVEEIGITLKDPSSSDIKILLWPQEVKTSTIHTKGSLERLEFIKKDPPGSPLVMTISDTSKLQGPAEGFLYLSYLFAAKHDYQMAKHYLSLAASNQIQNETDLSNFTSILESFRNIPGSSMRLNAIKLKAELIGYKIIREQTEPQTPASMKEKALEKNEGYLIHLIQKNFRLAMRPPLRHLNSHAIREHLENDLKEMTIDQEDLDTIQQLINHKMPKPEEMDALSGNKISKPELSERLQNLSDEEKGLWSWTGLSLPPEVLEHFPISILTMMESTNKKGSKLLEALPHSPPESVLNHFFHLWNEILTKKVKPKDLVSLFGPIPTPFDPAKLTEMLSAGLGKGKTPPAVKESSEPDEGKEDPLKIAAQGLVYTQINMARKLLLSLAERAQDSGHQIPLFDLKRLKNTQGNIPGSIPGIMGTGIGSFFRKKPSKKYQDVEDTQKYIEKQINLVFKQDKPVVKLDGNVPNKEPTSEEDLRSKPGIDPVLSLNTEMIQDRYNEQTLPQVNTLQEAFKAKTDKKVWPHVDTSGVYEVNSFASLVIQADKYLSPVDTSHVVMSPDKLKNVNSSLQTLFDSEAINPIEKHENELLKAGCDKIEKKLAEMIKSQSHVINLSALKDLNKTILEHQHKLAHENNKLRSSIIKAIKTEPKHHLPDSIKWAAANVEKIGDSALFDALLNSYQKMEPKLSEKIQEDLLKYLIQETESRMLDTHGKKALNLLMLLKDQRNSLKSDLDIASWQQEWNLASFDLQKVIATGTNRTRYLNAEGNLNNPRFTRKYLVAELRTDIILSQDQVRIIEEMVQDPSNWYELRMGLGKTSFIFPIVLMLLAEEGALPVGLVKRQLLNQNAESLDRTTRSLLDQAAGKFSFDIHTPSTYQSIADRYLRLLKAKEDQGYLITTVGTIASIEHKLLILRHNFSQSILGHMQSDKTFKDKHPEFQEDPESIFDDIKLFEEAFTTLSSQNLKDLEEIQKEAYWLSKIRSLLKDDKTQLIGDEVDDLFNPTLEDNLAVGKPIELNPNVCNVIEVINKVIHESKTKEIVRLKNALISREQAALRPKEVRDIMMPALFKEVWKEPAFRKALGVTHKTPELQEMLDHIKAEDFVEYACRLGNNPIDTSMLSEDAKKHLVAVVGALKHINASLPLSLQQDPDIDIGVKKTDGFTVGPQVSGEEKEGMLYGDEYDVIVNHYMTYAFTLPDTPFIKRSLLEFQERNPIDFEPILEKSKKLGFPDVFTFLRHPDSWNERLTLLRIRIVNERMVKRYDEQHVFNVQEAVYDTNIGGMSGTMNPYLFPTRRGVLDTASKNVKDDYIPRSVESETFLRIGCMPKPDVHVASEKEMLSKMASFLSNNECKAIINEGSSLQGKNALEAVKALRETKEGAARTFIFIDPASRKPSLWGPGDSSEPLPIDQTELNKLLLKNPALRASSVFYFGPLDTRGTDFKIPPGFGVVISGPTTNIPNWMQAVWRLRGLGQQHTCQFIIPEAVQKRISEEQKVDNNEITWKNLVQDLKAQTLGAQQGINVKATKLKITSPLKKALRDILSELTGGLDPVSQEKAFFDASLYKMIHDLELLIVPKRINFEQDFAETKLSKIEDQIKTTFDQEFEKIRRLKERIAHQLNEALASGADASPQVKSLLATLNQKIVGVEERLKTVQKDVISNIEEHKKHLPAEVPYNGGGEASSQEQVQEQQQQQQQEQQQEQVNITPVNIDRYSNPYYKWDPKESFITIKINEPRSKQGYDYRVKPIENEQLNYSGFSTNSFQSDNFKTLYETWSNGRLKGDPLGRIAVVGKSVILISHSDYHYDFNKYLRNLRKENDPTPVGVYSFVNGAINDKDLILNDHGAVVPDVASDPDLRQKIVQMKWRLGYYQYSKQELKDLETWILSTLDTDKMYREYFGPFRSEKFFDNGIDGSYYLNNYKKSYPIDFNKNLRNWTANNCTSQQLDLFDKIMKTTEEKSASTEQTPIAGSLGI